ncbi:MULTISPECIES: 3-hydroxybutyryl-CoA dehydrogenase [unclassified Beijerinckia]|uniref:3-hydroxybutyryl-CoA dehydrogenase n=1 Tax=unclassified Beijerinckia TaxID=2638183 RepID=UPI000899A20D|nr:MULTISPECIES: 3-hydroxybutyryl-CoA dehydrogenase [unclassified Beijerinckia]MDH7797548.1 3-hydroxybutyryl-CoA dehydrogenase [Beijerinckia sp. GAS462]SEC90028.1 3-hydroxyacyl-CoA dehydrogenase [Beijerinckia sp. 28-YEA-48]
MSTDKSRIGVVGAGTMGNGIAQLFAAAGHPVTLRDLKPEFLDRGMAAISDSLGRLVAKEKLSAGERDAVLARITPTTEAAALADCAVVVEAVVENYEIKAALIRELDTICGDNAIFATNTSSISVTRLAAASKDPSRVIGMHFFNPVPLMQLVEVIRALQTSDATNDTIVSLTETLGKTARVSKDSYGFVVNRVLVPMINEAINCVHEGVATPEDVDVMMKLGTNQPMGPLALADLIGLDVVRNIMDTLYNGFDDPKYRPSPLLKQMCDAGYLGRKTGRGFFIYTK